MQQCGTGAALGNCRVEERWGTVATTMEDAEASEQRWERRFAHFAETIEGLTAAREDELEARDLAIVQAIDVGWSRRRVARWAHVSETRVTQIIARRCAR